MCDPKKCFDPSVCFSLGLLTLLQPLTDAYADTLQTLALSPQLDSGICFILITSKPQSTPVEIRAVSWTRYRAFMRLSFIPNKRKLAKATPSTWELSLPLSSVSLIVSFLFHISWSPWKHYESKHQMFPGIAAISTLYVPKFERVLERSMMACLLGLFRTERLAREMSAVTRVIDILKQETRKIHCELDLMDLIWKEISRQTLILAVYWDQK